MIDELPYSSSLMTADFPSSLFLSLSPTSSLLRTKTTLNCAHKMKHTCSLMTVKLLLECVYTCVVILCSGELLLKLVFVVWVELIIQGGSEPVRLWLVEDRGQGVRDINNAPCLAWHHKQEAISSLQNKMLKLLQTDSEQWRSKISCGGINLKYL